LRNLGEKLEIEMSVGQKTRVRILQQDEAGSVC
jgi:hypothetical protein